MDLKQYVILALQVSIWATVFGFGLHSQRGDGAYLVRRPNLLARVIVAMLVVMPVAAIVLARIFRFDPAVEIAIIALAMSPVPPLLPRKETKAGGSGAFAVAILATLGVLSIVTIPATLEVLERLFGTSLSMSPAAIASVILKSIIAPLAIGIALRVFAPSLADMLDKVVTPLAKVLLALGVLALLIAVFPSILALATGETLLAIILFTVIGLAVGHAMGGPDPDHSVVLALSASSRHPMIAYAIASANYPELRFGGTIVLALLVNGVVGALYLAWQRKQHPVSAIGMGPRHA
jgi:BASS family bile acid:Na+ symporter